ncbi:sensor histidine kinase [Clostridium simiarum]|nr:ATP-binding protein [Clostridium simiarum]
MIKEFIVTFIELSAFMVLWQKFALKKEIPLFKKLFIIAVNSFVMAVTSGMGLYWNMGLSYLVLIFSISYLSNNKLISNLLEIFSIVIVTIILQLIIMFVMNFLNLNKNFDLFTYNVILNSIILIITLYIYYIDQHKINIKMIDSKIGYCFILNFASYLVILKVLWDYDKNIILNNIIKILFIQAILLILNIILYYYIIKINEEKKAMLIQSTYTPIIKKIIEEIRGKQHEFKNHLNTISGIVQVAKDNELRVNLKEYIRSIDYCNNTEDIIYINNPILGAIIYSKVCEAKNNNIKFSYHINNDLNKFSIKEYELSEILNNLLTNAFEAAQGDKEVILNILSEDDKNIIEVKNKGEIKEEEISKLFKRGFSTKDNKSRGYGLYNVKRIVELNRGTVQLFLEEESIVFKVLL